MSIPLVRQPCHKRAPPAARKLLNNISAIEPLHQDVSAQQALMVAILRERAVSWADIGQALGVTRQAAWRRFATEPEAD